MGFVHYHTTNKIYALCINIILAKCDISISVYETYEYIFMIKTYLMIYE